MNTSISKERLNIIVKYDVFSDADDLLQRLQQMDWKRYNRREHKDYGEKGISYNLKFGGYKGIPLRSIHRDVIDWTNEDLLLKA